MTYTGTYSPEDNKLAISTQRLEYAVLSMFEAMGKNGQDSTGRASQRATRRMRSGDDLTANVNLVVESCPSHPAAT
jgi:hypothetical protein